MSTGIQWTDETWNPIRGCSRVSAGCVHCYAETTAGRFAGPGQPYEGLVKRVGAEWRWTGEVRVVEKHLMDPLRWRTPRRVFVNSMSDLFHERVSDDDLDRIFAVMALAPQHIFQVLTKRPARMQAYMKAVRDGHRPLCAAATTLRGSIVGGLMVGQAHGALALNDDGTPNQHQRPPYRPFPNVWLGVSCENQETLDERVPLLLETPAAVRFISAEPLLGPLDFDSTHESDPFATNYLLPCLDGDEPAPGLDWVIVGGESGPQARSCAVEWVRSVVRQCQAAGVSVFVKQLGAQATTYGGGEWPLGSRLHVGRMMADERWAQFRDRKGGDPEEWPVDLRVREMPRAHQEAS